MEKQNYKGYEITVDYEPDPINPRHDNENLGIMALFHTRYDVGDRDLGYTPEQVAAIVRRKDVISFPVYMYDHSGVTINTEGFSAIDSYGWDWGQLGFIFVDHARARQWLGISRVTAKQRKRIQDYLLAEVKEYDGYLRGDRYYYRIEKDGEVLDVCGEFDDWDYTWKAARSWIDIDCEEAA